MLGSILLVLALSLDAFAASIAYGTNKIRIPLGSILVINFVCSLSLGISLLIGSAVKMIVPGNILIVISFLMLMVLGVYYLFEGIIKASIGRSTGQNKRVKLRLFDVKFIIEIYVDGTKADFNYSKSLSSREAIYLAMVLSLDSLAVGFGSSIVAINCWQVLIFSLVFGIAAIWGGMYIGRRLAKKIEVDVSWIGGIILIILAFMKLI
ncbi:MAG TPA: sporulation membrane protein YtaF [Clostridia bacterium]|nr:sporulation membrane protein YtaF [Clostridia bacterium]